MKQIEISEEDRLQLVEQLEALTGKRPLFDLKFCACEKFANDVCAGNLYANTPKYFREQEIKSSVRGQGDKFELISTIETKKITMCDAETGEIFLTAPKGTMRIQFKDDDVIPLVSFVGIPLSDMKLVYADDKRADFVFPFSEEEYVSMAKNFGAYCVIINGREIESHIRKYADASDCEYLFDKIEYCSQQRIDRIQAFNKRTKERFLYKNSDLVYQREYRLAFGHEIPDDHFIRIGTLVNTKILKSEKLKDMCFSIEYTSHLKSDE